MTATTRERQLANVFLNEMPANLLDTMNGGLERTILDRPHHETPEEFTQRHYGESYEIIDQVDALYFHVRELVMNRGIQLVRERSADTGPGEMEEHVMWCIDPVTGIDASGKLFFDYDKMNATIGEKDEIFGASVLMYQHWMLIGFDHDLQVRAVGQTRANGLRRPMLEAVPHIPTNDQQIAVIPNPLLYIPRPEDMQELEAFIGAPIQRRYTTE